MFANTVTCTPAPIATPERSESPTSLVDEKAEELDQETTSETSETTSSSVEDKEEELSQKTTVEQSESTTSSLDDEEKFLTVEQNISSSETGETENHKTVTIILIIVSSLVICITALVVGCLIIYSRKSSKLNKSFSGTNQPEI
ncbi:hypothetical protein RF11_07714 [Thelohanellus kitauei]|uniref:Uncharacterized protein n=1 Tax=Thelohanellus kitauei TaxID=669202 RepID=A0A0C2MHU5_THEKT|nr:hypothetical protein RF11_12077 [Thelohanellus kitauei]KII67291.1 hypothetical protein RF11_07714 [Thelohanellus kitauei]